MIGPVAGDRRRISPATAPSVAPSGPSRVAPSSALSENMRMSAESPCTKRDFETSVAWSVAKRSRSPRPFHDPERRGRQLQPDGELPLAGRTATYAAIGRPASIASESFWNTARGMSGWRITLCALPISSSCS